MEARLRRNLFDGTPRDFDIGSLKMVAGYNRVCSLFYGFFSRGRVGYRYFGDANHLWRLYISLEEFCPLYPLDAGFDFYYL